MTQNWAHFTKGRTYFHDCWEWVAPLSETKEQKKFCEELFKSARQKHSQKSKTEARLYIAFDSNRWYVAHYSSPQYFLDNEKFPPELYSRDGGGKAKAELVDRGPNARPLDWMHGFTSETADFPLKVPNLDRGAVAKLHEDHIIPVWQYYAQPRKACKKSEFQAIENTVAIESLVPEVLLQKLQKAAAQGQPILLEYDFQTKQCADITASFKGFAEVKQSQTSAKKKDKNKASEVDNTTHENTEKPSNANAFIALLTGGAALIGGLFNLKKKQATESTKEKAETTEKTAFNTGALIATAVGVAATGWAVMQLMSNHKAQGIKK